MRNTSLLIAFVLAGLSTHACAGRDRYLLLDSRIIESTDNVKLSVGVVRKDRNNPLFKEDKPCEPRFDNPYCSVIYDRQARLCSFNFTTNAAMKDSPKKIKRIDLTKIPSPQVLPGDENNHYRDPTAIYHDGVFRLFFTVNQPRDNNRYMASFLGTTTSRDLVNWTPVKLLTPENPTLNYSSPGNIIRYNGQWFICFQTYPIPGLKGFVGDQTARLFIMRSKDLENWSEPELLKVKGPDVPREQMGRMIDPYLIKDKDEPGKWWCFYKQNGVSMSYSYDLETWRYFGRQKAGENSCVLVLGDRYYLIHSPGRDGMGLMSSGDLKNWEPVVEENIRLGYKVWLWAMARLTAGFVLDLKEDPRVGKYLMFYHGTESDKPHEHIGICSLGIAWSDDLINWNWPKKPEREEKSGKAIFDGRTLDGWYPVPKESASDWTVRDGTIVGHGSADRLSYLVWKDENLTDFELKLRYRLPGKGNTGVEIRSKPDLTGKRPFEGYHADLGHVGIGPNILGAWDFHFAKRKEYPCPRGTRLTIDEEGKPHSSSIPGAVTLADIRPHQWNDVHIIANGNHFRFFINGKLASEFTDNAKSGRLDYGAIGLQIHDKDMRVEFKDIYLKKLETKETLPPFTGFCAE